MHAQRGDRVGQCEAHHLLAVVEGIVADGNQRVGTLHADQCAALEGIVSNADKRVGEIQMSQIELFKGVRTDDGDAVGDSGAV